MSPFGDLAVSTTATWAGHVYLAGDFAEIRGAVRAFCSNEGACFSISPANYVYSGGEESGAVVTLISYARFPKSPKDLHDKITRLAHHLLEACHQSSLSLVTPEGSYWLTRRRDR